MSEHVFAREYVLFALQSMLTLHHAPPVGFPHNNPHLTLLPRWRGGAFGEPPVIIRFVGNPNIYVMKQRLDKA